VNNYDDTYEMPIEGPPRDIHRDEAIAQMGFQLAKLYLVREYCEKLETEGQEWQRKADEEATNPVATLLALGFALVRLNAAKELREILK
jgi:hypothetical protein